MTKMIKDAQGSFVLPQTLRQGQSFDGGIVNFDVNTGKPLAPGATTTPNGFQLPTEPVPSSTPVVTETGPKKMTFTEALLDILKNAQGQNDQGQQQLNVQKNLITGQRINDAVANFKNPLLTPSSGSSLGMSAQNQFDPALETIAQQQERGTENFKSANDRINMIMDQYNAEQTRLIDEKAAAGGAKLTAGERYDSILGGYIKGFASGQKLPDGTPILDPNKYITPPAWKDAIANARGKGISRSDFIRQYADFLYPDNLSAYGLTPIEQTYITKDNGGA